MEIKNISKQHPFFIIAHSKHYFSIQITLHRLKLAIISSLIWLKFYELTQHLEENGSDTET